MPAAEYIKSSFFDFYDVEHEVIIYQDTEDEPTVIELKTDGRGYIIESKPEEETFFGLVYSSRCIIGLVAELPIHFDAIEQITTDADTYYIEVYRGGELHWRGRILKDFAIEKNGVFPQVIELTATDEINDLLERSSEELLRPADLLLPVNPIQFPQLFTQALKLLDVDGLSDIKMRVKGEWTTDETRTGGYDQFRNYLGMIYLVMPSCLKDGEEQIQIVNAGIASQRLTPQSPDTPPSQIITDGTIDKFMSIGKLFKMLLERLGLVFFYSNGCFYLVQRETQRENTPFVFEYNTKTYLPNTSPPNFGSNITGITDAFRVSPILGEIEANGEFSYQPKVRELEQVIIPSAEVELNTFSGLFADYRRQIPNQNLVITENSVTLATGVSSETLGQSVLQMNINYDATLNAQGVNGLDAFLLSIPVRIFLDISLKVGSDFYRYDHQSQTWMTTPANVQLPTNLLVVNGAAGLVSVTSGTPVNRIVVNGRRFIEVNIAPPPPLLTGDIVVKMKFVIFSGNQFTSTAFNAPPPVSVIDPDDAYLVFQSTTLVPPASFITGTAKLVQINSNQELNIFTRSLIENKNNGVRISRGAFMLDNLNSVIIGQRIGSIKAFDTIEFTTAYIEDKFKVDPTWRRRNGGADRLLYQLWFDEMQAQIEEVQKTYEGRFRKTIDVKNNVNYRGVIYKWLNYTYTAKPGTADGLLLEIKDNVPKLDPGVGQIPIPPPQIGEAIIPGSQSGEINGGIGNMFIIGTINDEIPINLTGVDKVQVAQLKMNIFAGMKMYVVDRAGAVLLEIESEDNISVSVDPQAFNVASFVNPSTIPKGSFLAVSIFQAFTFLASKIDF